MAVAALSLVTTSRVPAPASNAARIPAAAVCGVHCGTERWPVKTLSDVDEDQVRLTPLPSTVGGLVATPAPDVSSNTRRLNDIEKQVFTVHARLIGFKKEAADHDFHIVIQDPDSGETMIVEIPDPQCDGVCNSLAKARIAQARSDFLGRLSDRSAQLDICCGGSIHNRWSM